MLQVVRQYTKIPFQLLFLSSKSDFLVEMKFCIQRRCVKVSVHDGVSSQRVETLRFGPLSSENVRFVGWRLWGSFKSLTIVSLVFILLLLLNSMDFVKRLKQQQDVLQRILLGPVCLASTAA